MILIAANVHAGSGELIDFFWICEKRSKRDFESAGRAFESPRVRHS
jgi:hypothetical protein